MHAGHRAENRPVADFHVIGNSRLAGHHHVIARNAAAGNAHLRANEIVLSNAAVVTDLNLVIDFRAGAMRVVP